MTRQEELDLLETELLTDLFGGISADKMIFKTGIFKVDISAHIQKLIDRLEEILIPIMDDKGLIDSKNLKSVLNLDPAILSAIPNKKFRPIEVYRKLSPFLKGILK